MTEKITTFLNGLIIYDYILFGTVFTIFLLLIILGIVQRHKIVLALSLILLSFIVLSVGSIVGYIQMHNYLFKNTSSITSQKKLTYSQAVVVHGVVKNTSKFDFQSCKITVSAHKVSENSLKNYLFQFKPLKKMSILEYDILKAQEREFKLILEPFTYTKEYNISVGASCK
ncbi:MAG: DUF2393 domain-containing protein [Sulfurimonas sp.]|uniref:DUF2393 domain-containing protein n=1 Tax=Sulfurimonas sp. TaxID=2022749 RepID=UPI002626D810|nr:DUF2393 domain-containing protein [Sulfurimonas sp.]MCW8895632.1 DUF2393 domain-containing protein [Sulfurimonas sp.]MCW8954567.1 DUF2393 domain-containing protein [Sulfurimonas sp.]MCW9067948.1 DUF2393 domain-containing protein [Sulfurimonas sp.]